MKIFFAEAKHNYGSYFFPYQVLLKTEQGDNLTRVYQSGFLPFRNNKNLFYLSRSCRSNIENFSLSSENKRVLKNTSHLVPKNVSLADFKYTPKVQKACKDWAKGRGWKISTASLKTIFTDHIFNQAIIWKDTTNNNIICYQVLYKNDDLVHTNSVFYDSKYHDVGIGTRVLIEVSKIAHQEKLKHAYMGTCYAMYKRNIPGFEFFNGFEWSANIKELKYINEREGPNYLLKEKDYLENFQEGGMETILNKKGLKISL